MALRHVLLMFLVSLAAAQNLVYEDEDPPTEVDIGKMKVKELKAFLDNRGAKCEGCVEKGDFKKKALENINTPILPHKRKLKASKDPIWIQWAALAGMTCQSVTQGEKTCKAVKTAYDGMVMQHAKKIMRETFKDMPTLTKTTLIEPYKGRGVVIAKEVTQWAIKNDVKSSAKISKQFDKTVYSWLRDCALENTNSMYADQHFEDL